jgi:YD repeat-containing protein
MNFYRVIRLFLFLSVIVSFPSLLRGQANPYGDVSIASPTAASLGKYADIPVSYHTGIPQINIPLYTVKAGPISLPIGLSYHASGLKVIENASWVGAGWSLDAGGVITRTVMGQPDEKATNFGGTETNGYYSDTGYNKYLYSGPDQDWIGFSASRKDGEPDLFFFNFGGYTGKFFFRDDRMPILVPQQDLKIVPYYPTVGQSIQGFTVTTPDGAQYFFGNTPGVTGVAPTETTSTFSIVGTAGTASGGTAISSWFLNKVISADGQFVINLVYSAENYGYYTLSTSPLDPYSLPAAPSINLVKNMMSGVRLSQIKFPNGIVTFNPGQPRTDLSDNFANDNDNLNSSATTLGSISISSNSIPNSFCKKFVFNYSYFIDNTTPQPAVVTASGYVMQTDKSRLRLDSLKEMSCDNLLQIPARKFKYFSELLARRLNLGIDHWGFNNGITSNQNLIPTYTTNDGVTVTTITGANRDASWPAMRGGSLQQITYPTGGTTTFDFEPADSYTLSTSTQQTLLISGSASSVHLFGQSSHADTITFVSNGNTMTLTAFNNTSYLASISITNVSTNTVIYSNASIPDNNYPSGQTTTYTIPAAAGTYQYILSIPTNGPGSNEGASVSFSQIQTVITNTPVTIGGLRIKTITQKDSINNAIPIVTSYTYPSGGFLYSFPTYVQHLRNDLITNLGYWDVTLGFTKGLGSNNGCPLSGSYFVRSGGSLRPMATTQGYHIGYPSVKVSQTNNGYSIYNYYTSNTGYGAQSLNPSVQTVNIQFSACESNTPNYPPAPLSFDYRKGELYYEQHYNQAGQLLKDEYYYPQFDSSTLQPAPGFIVVPRTNSGGGQILFGTLYNLSSPRRTSMHTVETNYTPGMGGVQVDTYTYYGSAYHNQETRKVVTTSTGDSLITNTKYTPDFHSSSWDISPSCETTYTNNCSTCLTTYNNGQAGCGTDNTCLTNLFLAYRQCLSNARNTYVNSRIANYTGATNNYLTQHATSKTNAGTELKPILDLQDENRVVPIEVTDYRDGNLLKANFTRYDYVTSPAAFPYPNKTQLVSLLAPSSTFTNAVISGNTLSKDARYLDESTYGFLNGNPAKVTGHDGMNTIYIWDYINTNPIAKTICTVIDTTAYTSFEADGQGNWTIPSTVRDSSTAITGMYCYNLSSGSITKSGLSTGKKYTISYWSKNGSYSITGGTVTTLTGRSTNGWTYYEHAVTTTSTTLTISGSGRIDELRLYPQGAQMSSYTYKSLVGITTMNDPNSEITYYEYDGLERLKNIKDYQGNIIKNFQYNYVDPNACGPNCLIVTMQTFAGTNTISYPVGVFNVNGKLLGNATSQAQYISTWMADTADSHTGTIVAASDSMHFKFTVNSGRIIPNSLTGMRFYQYDLSYNQIDGVLKRTCEYVNFGDGSGMFLGKTINDTSNIVLAPNTIATPGPLLSAYFIHTYADTSLKTITLYHNDATEYVGFDNANAPATSLTLLKNVRGNYPQYSTQFDVSSYQQNSALTIGSITNWNSINSITFFGFNTGDGGINACKNIGYAQDFMQNNRGLNYIKTALHPDYISYFDSTFKINKLKSNWNTYFTNLQSLSICDEHWNREDLTALTRLSYFVLINGNQNHSNNLSGNPPTPIPSTALDNILNQIAAGAGQFVLNGIISIETGGTSRTSASDTALNFLKSKGWGIYFNDVQY